MDRLRVLIISEAANPELVSVPLVGWSHYRALAEVAHVHLVTQVRNRGAILRAGLVEDVDFTAVDTERVARPLWLLGSRLRGGAGKGWTTITALASISYAYFEHLLWKRFRSELTDKRYHLVHRLTPLSPTTPSPLARRCRRVGIPFVLGPLNGGVPWPRGFGAVRRREREWLSYVRSLHRMLPGYRSTRRSSAAIMIASRDTWRQMPAAYHHKCVYIPENGIDPARFSSELVRTLHPPVRLVFVGRLVPYKGVDMLLDAAAPLVHKQQVTIDIVGDGPMRDELEKMIRHHKLSAGVNLCGWVEHGQLQQRLRAASVFAFPSIREFGGGVVLEAMAVGLVPVIVDYGGPAELVTDDTGWKVPLGSRTQIVAGFRSTLDRIVRNPSILREMGARARSRVMTMFTWSAKARQTLEVYRWVTARRDSKPDFGMPLHGPSTTADDFSLVRSSSTPKQDVRPS